MDYNKIVINNAEKNETIYRYLKRNGYSENYIRNLRKKEGYIKLNNKIAFTNAIVSNDDLLELFKNPNTKSGIMQSVIPLNVVYEDNDVLVVNKPAGLATTPTRSHYDCTLAGAVLHYMSAKDSSFVVRIINRLDKDTSGLVCIAKHSLISNLLNSKKYITKTYHAICTGEINQPLIINKKIATTINELGYNNHKREILDTGKPAITYVTPVAFDGKNTLCKITLEHGRTHQIRVHLASEGHALLGDSLYGTTSDLIGRSALTCTNMNILNPLTKTEIKLNIDLPDDFLSAFEIKK